MHRSRVTRIYGTRFIALSLLAACILGSQGCGSLSREALQAGLDQGKSIVIFPRTRSWTYWDREEGEDPGSDFSKDVSIGKKYAAVAVAPGTYHIRSALHFERAEARVLKNTEPFASRFGTVRVEKTPEKKRVVEDVYDPPEYAWVRGKDGVDRYVQVRSGGWRTVRRVESLTSYYKCFYDFRAEGGMEADSVGTMVVPPDSVILVPGVWAGVELAGESCAALSRGEDSIITNLLDGPYDSVFLNLMSTGQNGFQTWYFQCPVAALTVTVAEGGIADLLYWADPDKVPEGVLDRVTTGEFLPGRMFAEEHAAEEVVYEETFLFSEDVRYTATRHIFSGAAETGPDSATPSTESTDGPAETKSRPEASALEQRDIRRQPGLETPGE